MYKFDNGSHPVVCQASWSDVSHGSVLDGFTWMCSSSVVKTKMQLDTEKTFLKCRVNWQCNIGRPKLTTTVHERYQLCVSLQLITAYNINDTNVSKRNSNRSTPRAPPNHYKVVRSYTVAGLVGFWPKIPHLCDHVWTGQSQSSLLLEIFMIRS